MIEKGEVLIIFFVVKYLKWDKLTVDDHQEAGLVMNGADFCVNSEGGEILIWER